MTNRVEMIHTGRGPDSNRIDLRAGDGYGTWSAQRDMRPPIASIGSADDYIVARWAACVAWLNRWSASESGNLTRAADLEGHDAGSLQTVNVALVAVAHWNLETGFGANEYNWNAGGIHCSVNSENCFRESERTGGEEFRSFASFAEFAQAYFELISRTPDYQPAWEAMKAGSANALLRLWRADYTCGAKTKAEATSLCMRVRRTLSARWASSIASALPTEAQIRATEADVPYRCRPNGGNMGLSGSGIRGGDGGGATVALLGAGLLLLLASGDGGRKART